MPGEDRYINVLSTKANPWGSPAPQEARKKEKNEKKLFSMLVTNSSFKHGAK